MGNLRGLGAGSNHDYPYAGAFNHALWLAGLMVMLAVVLLYGCGRGNPGSDALSVRAEAGNESPALECVACHEAGGPLDPLISNGTGAAGKHIIHVVDRGYSCDTCHTDYYTAETHFDGQRDTGNPNAAIVRFTQENDAGVWTADPATLGGTCASLFCHGAKDVSWNDVVPLGCTDCHAVGGILGPGAAAATGSLNASVLAGGALDQAAVPDPHETHLAKGYDCEGCHSGYTESTTHADFKRDADNPDVSIVSFRPEENPLGVWTGNGETQAGSCANVACHGGAAVVSWAKGEPLGCTACHSGGGQIDPLATNGAGAEGKHIKHAGDKGYACETCHLGYTLEATHVNFQLDTGNQNIPIVRFDGSNPDASWNSATASCATLYCHGATDSVTTVANEPSWYTSSALVCTSCHSTGSFIDPVKLGNSGPNRNRHGKHIVSENISDCETCHLEYTWQDTHADLSMDAENPSILLVNFSGDALADGPATWSGDTGPATGACGLTCHREDHRGENWYR